MLLQRAAGREVFPFILTSILGVAGDSSTLTEAGNTAAEKSKVLDHGLPFLPYVLRQHNS